MDHDRISDIESYVDPSSFLYPTINLLTEKKYTLSGSGVEVETLNVFSLIYSIRCITI